MNTPILVKNRICFWCADKSGFLLRVLRFGMIFHLYTGQRRICHQVFTP